MLKSECPSETRCRVAAGDGHGHGHAHILPMAGGYEFLVTDGFIVPVANQFLPRNVLVVRLFHEHLLR